MTDGERLQRIGELFAELMLYDYREERQRRLFRVAQETLIYVARRLRFTRDVLMLNTNGRIGFCLTIRNPAGSAAIYYDPSPALEKLLEQLEKEASEEIARMGLDDDEEGQEMASDVYYSFVTRNSEDFTERLLKLLYHEFEIMVKSLPEIAQKLEDCISEATLGYLGEIIVEDDDGFTTGGTEDSIRSSPKEDTPPFSVTEFINKSLRELNKERKKRWIAEVNSSLDMGTRGILRNLALHFQRVYPVWEQAKRIYKESQAASDRRRRERWRETILATYPELKDFSDLVERLADAPQLPEDIHSKLEEKGGSSARSDIALEHAARLCGASPYEYTIRHLKNVLSKQGMSVKKVKFIPAR